MILVTGGTGLVGSHLLFQLAQKYSSVRAIYREKESLKKVQKIFSYYAPNSEELYQKIEWIKADIVDVPSLTVAFQGITHVYHAAALISFNPRDYKKMRKINIEGTANIVNLSIEQAVKKLCYVSSIAAIGDDPLKETITEENEWNENENNHVYAITKYGAELEIWRGVQEGVDAVVVNPGVILGPGFWNTGSGKLFSQVANGFSFFTEGSSGFAGVNDVVEAMQKLMEGNQKNERYILVSENKTYKEILTTIANILKVKPPNKKVTAWQTEIYWRWEWFRSLLTRSVPLVTKYTAKSMHTISIYDNSKIKRVIDFEFSPIENVITEVASLYPKQD